MHVMAHEARPVLEALDARARAALVLARLGSRRDWYAMRRTSDASRQSAYRALVALNAREWR